MLEDISWEIVLVLNSNLRIDMSLASGDIQKAYTQWPTCNIENSGQEYLVQFTHKQEFYWGRRLTCSHTSMLQSIAIYASIDT